MSGGLWNSQIWVFLSWGYKINRIFYHPNTHTYLLKMSVFYVIKVSKFQNEFMRSSFLPKYDFINFKDFYPVHKRRRNFLGRF